MAPTYRQSNATFTYHNQNPKNRKTAGDCVIRAISYAMSKTWEETYKELCDLGFELKRMPNDVHTYTEYFKRKAIIKYPQPRKYDNTKYTLREFIQDARGKKGVIVVNLANHLTVIKDGMIYDTWDCGRYTVGNYWVIK